jgi:hypothetical protein
MTKTFALILGIKHTVLNQLVQAELNRVFHDAKHAVPLIVFIHASALKVPELISEGLFGLGSIINAAQLNDLTSIRAKPRPNHGTTTILAHLANGLFRKLTRSGISAHGKFSKTHVRELFFRRRIIAG